MISMWYHLSYDIIDGEDGDYDNLIKEIRKFPAYLHILKSGWVIKSSKEPVIIRDELRNSTSANIEIMITTMGHGDAAFLASRKINYLVNSLTWKSQPKE